MVVGEELGRCGGSTTLHASRKDGGLRGLLAAEGWTVGARASCHQRCGGGGAAIVAAAAVQGLGQFLIETKEETRARGLALADRVDGLMLGFAPHHGRYGI